MTELIAYNDFSKGLNDTSAPDRLDNRELVTAQNVDFSNRGGFSIRKGTDKLNTISFAGEVTQVIEFLVASIPYLLYIKDKKLYRYIEESDTSVELQVLQNDRVGYVIMKDKLYFCDQVEMYIYDGISVAVVTPYDPSQKEKVKIMVIEKPKENGNIVIDINGEVKTVAVATTESTETIATSIRSLSFTGYTASGTHSTVYFEADEVGVKENAYCDSNGTGIVISYETITEGKFNDNEFDVIKKCKYFVLHSESMRVFAAGNTDHPTRLYYSEIGETTYFKSTTYIEPTVGEGEITGLLSIMSDILISYNNSWFHYRGIDPKEDGIWKQLPIPYGCVCNESIVLTPFSFMFLGRNGLYLVSASIINQNITIMTDKSLLNNIAEGRIENTINEIKYKDDVRAIFYNNKYMLAYTDTDENNKVLIYDWDSRTFLKYTGWKIYDFLKRSNGKLVFASSNYIINTEANHYNDIDTATGDFKSIHMIAETKNFDLKYTLNSKFLQRIYLMMQQVNDAESSIDISLIADYKTISIKDINLAPSFVWSRIWGLAWGFVDYIQKVFEVNAVANRFKIRFESNKLNNFLNIYGIGFEYEVTSVINNIVDVNELLK